MGPSYSNRVSSRAAAGLPVLLALVLSIATVACSQTPTPFRPATLPSGRTIRVQQIGPVKFGQETPVLLLQYETDLKTTDNVALQKEVDEIWPMLRIDADKGKFNRAIISAIEPPTGFLIKKIHGRRFVYEKQPGGLWISMNK